MHRILDITLHVNQILHLTVIKNNQDGNLKIYQAEEQLMILNLEENLKNLREYFNLL